MPLQHKVFTIRLLYFKQSGKFYTEATEDMDCAAVETGSGLIPYMNSMVQQILGGIGDPVEVVTSKVLP